jgi:hypothetical protein
VPDLSGPLPDLRPPIQRWPFRTIVILGIVAITLMVWLLARRVMH